MTEQINPFVRALQTYDVLTVDEVAVLNALPTRERRFQRNDEIVRERDRPDQSCLVVEGFAVRAQFSENGVRQITALHIAGDFVDLHSLLLKRMDHSVTAFGPCRVVFIPHAALRSIIDEHRHLSRLFWLSTLVDAAIQRAWIAAMGAGTAPRRFAHLICEIFERLRARGLITGNSFVFPASQTEMGDILGLSTVHVNRTLQDLRAQGMVTWTGDKVTIEAYQRLTEYAGFDPSYLNLWSEPR